ncbi:MAG: rhodanese-like domain-containing protein [Rhodospirillales bacterium]|jgi:rhodanese-related sulfurtransferase|nr:rhodanese-like domain-containing protein [Rhodospirillales bacterium]
MPENFDPQTIWMVAILLVVFMATRYVIPRLVAGVPFMDPQTIQQRQAAGEEVVIVDVRTHGEFTGSLGHVPGAVNVPLNELADRLAAGASGMDGLKDLPVFVICKTANRSPSAARLLKKRGFTNVMVVKGGMSAWKRAGLPIERA